MKYLLALLLLVSGSVQAASLCVSTSGSDSASGAYPGQCFATAAKAATVVLAGDMVCFEAGNHAGMDISISGSSSQPV